MKGGSCRKRTKITASKQPLLDIKIRPMRPEDVPAAIAILAKWNIAPTPGRVNAERSSIDVERSFVAEHDDVILGTASYIMLAPTEAETASLAVDPAALGFGLGYRLQVTRLKAMRREGVRWVRTETDRPATIQWYIEKFGYERAGTNPKKHTFSLPEVDEWVVLKLDLEKWHSRRK
jgi:N-acetylglutamate synthase-like GNAT family acetyltransferase